MAPQFVVVRWCARRLTTSRSCGRKWRMEADLEQDGARQRRSSPSVSTSRSLGRARARGRSLPHDPGLQNQLPAADIGVEALKSVSNIIKQSPPTRQLCISSLALVRPPSPTSPWPVVTSPRFLGALLQTAISLSCAATRSKQQIVYRLIQQGNRPRQFHALGRQRRATIRCFNTVGSFHNRGKSARKNVKGRGELFLQPRVRMFVTQSRTSALGGPS